VSATVSPDVILKQLAALWTEEGKQGDAGVLRACSMTLVVLAEEGEGTESLGETLAALMPEHPARTILIRLRGAGERALNERVYQQCWRPFGQRQQICCEQIEIGASDAALDDLPSLILPLLVSDLPVIVWCRSPRLTRMAAFRDIASIANKLILDSAAYSGPADAIARLVEAQGAGVRLGDLAWTRLTRWRETLARVFDNRENLAQLPKIAEVKVGFDSGSATAAWYLAAWTANSLHSVDVKPKLSLDAGAGALALELSGEGFRVALARAGGVLTVATGDLTNCTNLPPFTDYLLLREELGIVRRDTVFERTLSSAARLAVSSPSA